MSSVYPGPAELPK